MKKTENVFNFTIYEKKHVVWVSGMWIMENPFFFTSSEVLNFIAEEGRKNLREELERSWAAYFLQDGSVDLSANDNYFHSVRYVDFLTGELKHKFVGKLPSPIR